MYNALIIDDEKHVRQVISFLGMWKENRLNPPLEAADGETALRLMGETEIHIVLVDIRMPVMDGMQFLEQATKRFPKSKYVIISGFSDFEYAKRAIRFRIMDYLLKPVSEDDLNNFLKRAVKTLDDEQELTKVNPSGDLIRHVCEKCVPGYMCCISSVRIAEGFSGWSDKTIQSFSESLRLTRSVGEEYLLRMENPYNLLIGILLPDCSHDDSAFGGAILLQLQKDLLRAAKLFQQTDAVTLTGLGPVTPPSASALLHSCNMAGYISSRLDIYSETPIVSADGKKYEAFRPSSLSSKKELIRRSLERNDIQYFQDVLKQYFQSLREKGLATTETILHNRMELLIILREYAEGEGLGHSGESLPSLLDMRQLQSGLRVSELLSSSCLVFEELQRKIKNGKPLSVPDILQEIKSYIDENYACDINLTLFADQYHMTKEYLSKQFKEEYGQGIYEYVLSFRMCRAGELLASSPLKVQEVSCHVGYTDTNYFSKAFKTYYGLSPKEYRQQKVNRPV